MVLLTIKIEVEKDVEKRMPFNFKRNIEDILKIVPAEHTLHLEKIKVVWLSPDKKQKLAYGLYYGKREGAESPTIVICASNILKGMPRIIFYIAPFIPKLLLSDTLYHEIAHHYQRISHGYTKEKWEQNAEKYSKKMRTKMILSTRIGKVIYLLKNILKKE